LRELLPAVAAHAALTKLHLSGFPLEMPDDLDAVVDIALSSRLERLIFDRCDVCAASAPALVRLLSGTTLTKLKLFNADQSELVPLLDAPAAALLAAALRANGTLTELVFASMGMWRDEETAAAAATLLAALPAHPSLRVLNFDANRCVPDEAAHIAGAALGALVAANAPALHELSVYSCSLGDAGLAPLFAALQRNTHLRTLKCEENDMSGAFARHVALPALRANTSLRMLRLSVNDDNVIKVPQPTLEALRRCDNAE
jgi:Ran GTPase-activating protein (RanGAP) involved in mRNA processing and transport